MNKHPNYKKKAVKMTNIQHKIGLWLEEAKCILQTNVDSKTRKDKRGQKAQGCKRKGKYKKTYIYTHKGPAKTCSRWRTQTELALT